jgi:N-acetylmuramoyl-L-alanine amidase
MVKVALDGGHGINTPGKRTPSGEREWTFNDKVVRSAIKHLNTYQNVEILRLDDPTGKLDVPLKERTDKANKWKANIVVSVHHNASSGIWGNHTGTETYVHPKIPNETLEIANVIHKEVVQAYGLRDRGVKRADFHMLRETDMHAVLVEGGFMDSNIDIEKLRNDQVLENAGKAIAEGIAKHYKLKKKPVVKQVSRPISKPQPKENTFYRVVTGSFADRNNAEQRIAELKKKGFDSFIDVYKK